MVFQHLHSFPTISTKIKRINLMYKIRLYIPVSIVDYADVLVKNNETFLGINSSSSVNAFWEKILYVVPSFIFML